jgi:hypothetical protein
LDQFAGGQTGKPWTTPEIESVVAEYFEMLRKQLRGERYTKADVVRDLRTRLPARSPGSIELKFQNISAILLEEDADRIGGYAPMRNYQHDLRDAVLVQLAGEHRLGEALAAYGSSPLVAAQSRRLATDDVLVPPPSSRAPRGDRSRVDIVGSHRSAMLDFRLKQLGDAGEEWVVDLERERLRRVGRQDLAEKVEWTAREKGDGLGYDVRSFYPDERLRLIEVKTTNYSAATPFLITRAEVDFSDRSAAHYSLYRVHGFARDPRIYVLDGSVSERARLEPSVYLGYAI